MKDKHGNFISRWVTYCHDPMGYRDFIHELRGTIWEEQLETLGGDDGKNVLKFVYTGWSGDKTEHQTNMKNTGVKKCQIFCAVRNVPESAHNVKILLDLMQVETLPLSFLMDLKFMAMSVGISQAGGRHSCPYCTGHKNAEGHWIEGPLRSLEGVEKDHENWLEETNGDENKLKNYNNAKYKPCLPKRTDGEPTMILDLCDPPSLHLFLGAGNKIWTEGETKCYGPYLEGEKNPWEERQGEGKGKLHLKLQTDDLPSEHN